MIHPKSQDPSQVKVSLSSESRWESRAESKKAINVDSLSQEGLSESESERSENDSVKTQDYIKEIKIKAKKIGDKCAEEEQGNKDKESTAAGHDENQKWKIFDPRANSSRYEVQQK